MATTPMEGARFVLCYHHKIVFGLNQMKYAQRHHSYDPGVRKTGRREYSVICCEFIATVGIYIGLTVAVLLVHIPYCPRLKQASLALGNKPEWVPLPLC